MAGKHTLRVATDEDAPKRRLSLAEAVESGTYLEILVAQRKQMIADVAEVSGPAKAAMHRQIALHSKEIAALQSAAEQEAAERVVTDDEAFDASAV